MALKMLSNKSSKKHAHNSPFSFSYDSMGTWWEIRIWDRLHPQQLQDIKNRVIQKTQDFDRMYSRFISDSFVMQTFSSPGEKVIPKDLAQMLRLYDTFYNASDGKITPLIGQALVDAGYDSEYSLQPGNISATPDFHDTIEFLSETTIMLRESVVLDLGALGKGFFIDKLNNILSKSGCTHYLINGSGDIIYMTPHTGQSIRVGLEHPYDQKKVVGTISLHNISICS